MFPALDNNVRFLRSLLLEKFEIVIVVPTDAQKYNRNKKWQWWLLRLLLFRKDIQCFAKVFLLFFRWNQQISCRSLRPEHLKTWANFLESRNRWKACGSPIDATRDAKCVRTIWKVGKRFRYYSPSRLVKKCKCKVFSMGAERNLKD